MAGVRRVRTILRLNYSAEMGIHTKAHKYETIIEYRVIEIYCFYELNDFNSNRSLA